VSSIKYLSLLSSDGRKYPWGNEFDKNMCNTSEADIEKTTPVTRYPNGVSPVGCNDMAGNVWEWIDSWYGDNEQIRVLRGGSWRDNWGFAHASRYYFHPYRWDLSIGFRCARTKK
jgi:formylglycine-generating enzyme required for sulfatase activity